MAHSLLHETPANKTSSWDAEWSMKMEGEKAWRMRIEWERQPWEQCPGGRAKGARLLVVLHFDRKSTRLNLRRSSLCTGRLSIRCSGEAGDVAAVYEPASLVTERGGEGEGSWGHPNEARIACEEPDPEALAIGGLTRSRREYNRNNGP